MIEVRVSPPEEPFRVVVVSASDVSRGPAVQRVLRAHLAALGSAEHVALTSAGTEAEPGRPMHPHMSRALSELTTDTRPHVSRRISERRLAQADLVLAVSREERQRVADLRPPVRSRTFTVVEFARLVAGLGDPVTDPRRLVQMVSGLRSTVRPVDPGEDDLEDPTPGEYRDHERVVRRVDHAARDIARALSTGLTPGVRGVPEHFGGSTTGPGSDPTVVVLPQPHAQSSSRPPQPRPPFPAAVATPPGTDPADATPPELPPPPAAELLPRAPSPEAPPTGIPPRAPVTEAAEVPEAAGVLERGVAGGEPGRGAAAGEEAGVVATDRGSRASGGSAPAAAGGGGAVRGAGGPPSPPVDHDTNGPTFGPYLST